MTAESSIDRIALLTEKGVKISYDSIWAGKAGVDRRQRENPDHISSVFIPLSAEEWCYSCQRDSEGYVGPCCGNTGQMQDILNAAFRDSGHFQDGWLMQIAVNAEDHEGFDTFPKDGMSDEEFVGWLNRWDEIEPWEKIGLVYQGVSEKLHWSYVDRARIAEPQEDEDEAATQKRMMRTLERGLVSLTWADLFRDDDEFQQAHANRLVKLARIVAPAQLLAKQLAESVTSFEGVGIVEIESGEVIENGYGYCIYNDEAEAKRFLEMMTSWENQEREEEDDPILHEDEFIADRVEIRPVRVSVANGIEVL